jgi:FkbM family methyltransferase
MVWNPEDLRTAPNVLVNTGLYEPVESAALMTAAAGAGVVFDIGANVGYYSLHWASRLSPGGKVHAFEPVPSTYEKLIRNIALNGLDDVVRPNAMGIGDEAKAVTIYLPDFSGSGAASLADLHPEETSVRIDAQIDTLDNYFQRSRLTRLDMAKVDVEGAELFVVKGGLKTISTHKPLLFMELLRKWSKPFGYHPNEVIALLAAMGYRCYSRFGEGLALFDQMSDDTVQTNFFFAHPDRHAEWLTANGLS